LPLFKRDWMWWMEVGLSNIVGVIIALVIAWFVVTTWPMHSRDHLAPGPTGP
jgi:hypothetical protein